ncbi:MAG: DTW domain-containing protein [Bauldia sp.]|nr:DTW domain-containing protein [Bauldia sp.]
MAGAVEAGDPAGVEVEVCPHCAKPLALCVCEYATPIENRVSVLVLQHPQEQDKLLGTARLTVHHLAKASFRVGLSWPSLSKAVGREVDPKRWGILYLGAAEETPPKAPVTVLEGDGTPVENQKRALASLEGIILLDGSWSQAKTLWWRNPWVLKARRIVIAPTTPSLYGKLRKEPRKAGLSTLEATAFLLSHLEQRPEIEKTMLSTFRRMLQRYRDSLPPPAPPSPRNRRRPRPEPTPQ